MSENPYQSPKDVLRQSPDPLTPKHSPSVVEVLRVTLWAIVGLSSLQAANAFLAPDVPWSEPVEFIGYCIGACGPTIALTIVATVFWFSTKKRK